MRVDLFSLETVLYDDTAFPIQARGNSRPAAPRGVPFSLLRQALENTINLEPDENTVATGGSLTLPAGRLLRHIVVFSNGTSRTLNIGTSPGGTDVANGETIAATTDYVQMTAIHNHAASTVLYFHGFTGSITVKLFY